MKKLHIYIFLLCGFISFSQQEASNWYFGENAGIQFANNGTVSVLDDGQLNTVEGCSSISDDSGNLLFYTDGITVYNRQHNILSNGFDLLGDPSSSQSAIVVPKPQDPDIYYIFTVGSANSQTGLKFSIVDMTLDGGMGAITQKNTNLLSRCAEKVSAVLKDCQTQSIWVIALSNSTGDNTTQLDTFHTFEVSSTGVNTTAVTSTISGLGITDLRGYLKFSPNGEKLACANIQTDGLFLFDFNMQTGVVSNDLRLNINNENDKPYGVDFSPNSKLLYVASTNDFFGPTDSNPINHLSALTQFNLTDTDIIGSQQLIDLQFLYRSALQLGPNGKIYRSMSATYDQGLPFLSVINNPNQVGLACNYENNVINLEVNNSTQGLPPFISSFFNQKIDIIQNGEDSTYLPLCEGETYTLIAEEIVGATYTWYQDNVLLTENSFILTVTESGQYEVLIELPSGNCETYEGIAFIEFFANPTVTNVSLIQCDEDGVNDGLTIFNLEEANEILVGVNSNLDVIYYNSYSDAENELNPIIDNIFENSTNPQTIFAYITGAAVGCSTIAEVSLEISTTQILSYSPPLVCDELDSEDGFNTFNLNNFEIDIQTINGIAFPITFYETYEDALLEQNVLVSPYNNTVPYNQTIFARAENSNACFGINEVYIEIVKLPEFEENETILYCLNIFPQTIPLSAGIINDSPDDFTYLWSNGETSETIQINQLGTYSVTATDMFGCSKSNVFNVEPSNTATFNDIIVIDATENNTITVLVSGEGEYEYALYDQDGLYATFQSENIFYNVYGGIYTVAVRDIKNDCGFVTEEISLIAFPKFFTPNGDGYNDTWNVKGISNVFQPNTMIRIFDRYGKLVKQLTPLGNGWNGTFNGESLPSDDYWFSVTLQDGRKYQSHFTLKR